MIPQHVVVVHGLNNSAAVMQPLIEVIRQAGLSVEGLRLAGHEAGQEWPRRAYSKWSQQLRIAASGRRAEEVAVIGFSLGAVLCMANSELWQKGVFFSPPVYLHSGAALLCRAMGMFESIPVPSFAPGTVRAKRWNSTSAYLGLIRAIAACREGHWSQQLFIGDPKDRLVNWAKLKQRHANNKFIEVNSAHPSHHLTTVPKVLSERDWDVVTSTVLTHLHVD